MNVYIYGLNDFGSIAAVYGVARSLADAQKFVVRKAKRDKVRLTGDWRGSRRKGWGAKATDGICSDGTLVLWVIERVMP